MATPGAERTNICELVMYDVAAIAEDPLLLEPLRRSVESFEVPSYLRSLKIKLTARCNLKCVMCRYGRGWAPPELETERWLEVLREAATLGCSKVHFSGGEILIRRDFEALAERAASERMKVTLTSNLTLLTKDRAKRLLDVRLSSISTSLDGASAKVHERVRGIPGSFKRTLRALAFIARTRPGDRPKLRINFVMMRDNFRDYPALIRLGHELGAIDVVPMPVDSKRSSLRLSKSLIREYNELIAPEVSEARAHAGMPEGEHYVYPFGREKGAVEDSANGRYAAGYYEHAQCYAPFLHAFLAWDGNVYLCCMTNGRIESLGNVREQSLSEIFRGQKFQAVRRAMVEARLPACHACDMYLKENQMLARALGHESLTVSNPHNSKALIRLPIV